MQKGQRDWNAAQIHLFHSSSLLPPPTTFVSISVRLSPLLHLLLFCSDLIFMHEFLRSCTLSSLNAELDIQYFPNIFPSELSSSRCRAWFIKVSWVICLVNSVHRLVFAGKVWATNGDAWCRLIRSDICSTCKASGLASF
ncbi:unnamed protein product [Vicia faba]|uniref:Uncharacterized protein n=1 Tax=Vicia faba TaxID=3906 RepID=A0AAV1B736_VICFA|nr:unnamed protein product [Vicia faba]